MDNKRIQIRQKIFLFVFVSIIFLLGLGIVSYFSLSKINNERFNQRTITELKKINTSLIYLSNSIRNSVYVGVSTLKHIELNKEELSQQFKSDVSSYRKFLRSAEDKSINGETDTLLITISKVSDTFLKNSDNYFSLLVFRQNESTINELSDYDKDYFQLMIHLNDLDRKLEYINESNREVISSFIKKMYILIALICIVGIALSLFLSLNVTDKIVQKVKKVKYLLSEMGKGSIPKKQNIPGGDEINDILSSLYSYPEPLEKTSQFTSEIGKGNFSHSFTPLSNDDVLGHALIEMRDNLQKVSIEDKRRNWINEGIAEFGNILRAHTNDIKVLPDKIISYIVKYIDANQGSLYFISDDESHKTLELAACFAWDKKKYITDKIEFGQGLIGQAWREGDSILITEVPDSFIRITSGLGEANPNCILIVPLKINEEVFGVLELASFRVIEAHEREFVEKISDNIASMIASAKTAERTNTLLGQSQQQAEEMRAQEEEMRQNMEELAATQEEMSRKEKEYIQRIEELENQINKPELK